VPKSWIHFVKHEGPVYRKQRRSSVVLLPLIVFLLLGYQNCSGDFKVLHIDETSLGSLSESAQFKCTDPSAKAVLPSYMLTKTQYQNALANLFGADALQSVQTDLSTLLDDTFNDAHVRTSQITPDKVEAYFRIANGIADYVVDNTLPRETVFGACASGAAPDASCLEGYLSGFAKNILRRPLNDAELTTARQIGNGSGDYKTNLKAVLALHLQSPFFLWRIELGKTVQLSNVELQLTPYEIASRISFETADGPPDAELMSAADRNELSTLPQVRAQVARMLRSPGGHAKVQRNIMRWAISDSVADIASLPAGLKQDVDVVGLDAAMSAEMKTYIDEMIFTRNTSFRDLLTSKLSYASHPGLAKIYGHDPVTSDPVFMPGRRQGLLMRAPFLSGANSRTGIIRRGVQFQKRILCNTIPSPTADIVDLRNQVTFTHDELLAKTTREAIQYQTKAPVCMGCHSMINPTGFAFETFDPLGRLRDQEAVYDQGNYVRSLPVDSSGSVPFGDGTAAQVEDAFDLVTSVADSPRASACFSRNIFRFIYERKEDESDSCRLGEVHKRLADPSQPVFDALVEAISNDAIFVKKVL
jgi:hypothetical protein